MTETSLNVLYHLTFEDGEPLECAFSVGAEKCLETAPDWARLDFHQCSNCPLDSATVTWCPFALALAEPVALLAQRNSYDPVQVTVRWRDRTLVQATSLQRVLSVLIGLLGATSGCPRTRLLEPMAHFHQPFSQSDETLFRMLGSYLIGQLLRAREGLSTDFELQGLAESYAQLRLTNRGLAERLRHASKTDQSVNGLILLDILAAETLDMLGDLDETLRPIFAAYLPAKQ